MVPDGPAVAEIYPALRALLDGEGPALLPVPAADPVRRRILVEALRPDDAPSDPAAPRAGELAPLPGDTALIAATSGSTGTPKGAMLPLRALRSSAEATEERLAGPGRWLLALPAHHIAGMQVVLRALAAGAPPEVLDVSAGFDPAALPAAVRALESASGTAAGTDTPLYTSLVPGQLLKILDHPDHAPIAALARFHTVLLGGAASDPQLLERAAEAGISVVRTYGSSETAGGCVYDGVPLAGTEVHIDADSRVWLGGPTVASGYRNAPGHPAFAEPGWFRTDDAGLLSEGVGELRILGRLDAAISVGGLTILPQVIEAALREHPAVGEAVVVGEPDPRLGSRLVAVIQRSSGQTIEPGPHEMTTWVRERLGAHSSPARFEWVDALPLLGNGKIDRKLVEARVRQ